jgi:excisionase family DNA binding protein
MPILQTKNKPATWLSLSDAAERLGVHFTTLRRWADAGAIESLRTPGGRRRFRLAAIDEFIRHRQFSNGGYLPAPAETHLIGTARSALENAGTNNTPWMERLSIEQRFQFRQTGNRLTVLLMQYTNHVENNQLFLQEAKRIAAEYGLICIEASIPLTQAIRAFQFFQRSILGAIHETDFLAAINEPKSQELFQHASYFFDEALIALVEPYQSAYPPLPLQE